MAKRKSNGDTTVVIEANESDVGQLSDDDAAVGRPVTDDDRPKIAITRRERFINQAERRVNNALKRLQQVRNLGNRSTYEGTEEEYNKILAVLQLSVNEIRSSFAGGRAIPQGFRL